MLFLTRGDFNREALLPSRVLTAPARASRRLPTVVRRPMLRELHIRAEWMSRPIPLVRRAEELSGFLHCVPRVREQLLISRGIGRISGKICHIAGPDDHDIDAGRSGDLIGVRHTRRRLDHDDDQHIVVHGLAVVDAVHAPDSRRLATALAAMPFRWILEILYRLLRLLHGIDRWHDYAQQSD